MMRVRQASQGSIVSIVVPIYNSENTLRDCLVSLEEQAYDNIELILVDDGSTDSSGIIIDEFESRFGVPIVIHKANGGLSSARNKGIEAATGAYIGLVDSDDVVSPHFVSTLVEQAECTGCDVVAIRSASRFPEGGSPIALDVDVNKVDASEMSAEGYLREVLNHRADMGAQFRLYSARLLKRERFTEGLLFEDFDLLNRLLPNVDRVCMVDDPSLYAYRLSANGIIAGKYLPEKTKSMCRVTSGLMKSVKQHWPALALEAQSYCFTTFRMIFAQIPSGHPDQQACWQYLKKYRSAALRNAEGRMGDRISALLAYGGMPAFRGFCVLCRRMGLMR